MHDLERLLNTQSVCVEDHQDSLAVAAHGRPTVTLSVMALDRCCMRPLLWVAAAAIRDGWSQWLLHNLQVLLDTKWRLTVN
jgi:hypothetical protein